MQITRRQRRAMLEGLFRRANEQGSKRLYKYIDGEDLIQVQTNTFNIVQSRDIRKNVRIAAEMAVTIAREHPEKDVFYINTYAGVALMKEAFAAQLTKAGLPVPEPGPDEELEEEEILEPDDDVLEPKVVFTPEEEAEAILRRDKPWLFPEPGEIWVGQVNKPDGHFYLLTDPSKYPWPPRAGVHVIRGPEIVQEELDEEDELDEEELEEDEYDGDEYDDDAVVEGAAPVLSNLFIHDVPYGEWDTDALQGKIEECWHASRPVVILNSFEFASVSSNQKAKMVTELLDLQKKMGLTFLIFSHEMRLDRAAGLPGRGPLGILCSKAGSVERIKDPFEHMIRTRSGEKTTKNGVIHEAQMHSANPMTSETAVTKSTDQGKIWEYSGNPWGSGRLKSGGHLGYFAKSLLLKAYYNEHEEEMFVRGEEPTTALLKSGEYVKPDRGVLRDYSGVAVENEWEG